MDKLTVRSRHLELMTISAANRQNEEAALVDKLTATSAWQTAQVIATTMSQSMELQTKPICQAAWQAKKIVVVPKTFPHRQMKFYQYDQETRFEQTKFGVMEPVNGRLYPADQIDLMIVPGVSFTQQGKRLGFGGGFYDRYLANFHGQTIALAMQCQLAQEDEWERDAFDIDVQMVLTSGGSYD